MSTVIGTADRAIAEARAGEWCSYVGDLYPPLGTAQWDSAQQCWAVRVAAADVPYSCGNECCGIETPAVVAVELNPNEHHK